MPELAVSIENFKILVQLLYIDKFLITILLLQHVTRMFSLLKFLLLYYYYPYIAKTNFQASFAI